MANPNIVPRAISALAWGSLGSAARIGMQFAAQIILARLLGPEQFGVFATALIAVTLANFFADFGMAYSLIQKKDVVQRDVRFVFTWQIFLGVLVAVMLYFAAPRVAEFFHSPQLTPIIEGLSAVCVLNSMAATSLNLLKRELNFKRIHLANTVSYAIGYIVVGISLASMGAGIEALVAAFLTTAVLNVVLLYSATRHSLRPCVWTDDARQIVGYGTTVLATNVVNWIVSGIDRAIVGRYFPATSVGYYATSFNFVYSPAVAVVGVIQPALFSASARIQGQEERLRSALLGSLAAVSLLIAPIFVGIATVSTTLVAALYGDGWRGLADHLPAFALAMPFMAMLGVTTPTLWVSGRIRSEFLVQLPVALLVTIACYLAAQISTELVAWAVLALFVVRAAIMLTFAARAVGLSMRDVLCSLRGGLLICATLALVTANVDSAMTGMHASAWISLVVDIGSAAIVLAGGLYMRPQLIHEALGRVLIAAAGSLGSIGNHIALRIREGAPRSL